MPNFLLFWLVLFGAAASVESSPKISLSDAVRAAAAGSTIFLESAVYSGPANCDVQIRKSLSLVSPTSQTVIDCQGASRCLTVSSGASVTILGVTMINGNAFPQSAGTRRASPHQKPLHPARRRPPREIVLTIALTLDSSGRLSTKQQQQQQQQTRRATTRAVAAPSVGGCLWVLQSSVVLRNVMMRNCTAQYGSGLGAQHSSVVVSETVFHRNGARLADKEVRGGGAYLSNCSAHFVNVTASENSLVGTSAYGGGLYFELSSPVVLEHVSAVQNLVMSNGVSGNGRGGGYVFYICNGVRVSFSSAMNNTILNGKSGFNFGAGFYSDTCTSVSFLSSTALSNTISASGVGKGAGFSFLKGVSVSLISTTAISNTISSDGEITSGSGGGFYFATCYTMMFRSSLAARNLIVSTGTIADGIGGGYYFYGCNDVFILSSPVEDNTIVANSGNGGGLAVFTCVNVTLISSSAIGNSIMSTKGGGGGYYFASNTDFTVISSNVHGNMLGTGSGCGLQIFGDGPYIFRNVSFTNNVIFGAGGGGAIATSSDSITILESCLLSNNTARQGGALYMAGLASLTLSRCLVTQNTATLYAGALATTDNSQLTLLHSVFEHNIAPRFPGGLAIGDGDSALFRFSNTSFFDSFADGPALLLVGQVDFTDNVWASDVPGSVFIIDSSAKYFSLTFSSCRSGTYSLYPASTAINQTRCFTCPFGAICEGADSATNGLRAQQDYFGVSKANHEVEFRPCPPGFCCGDAVGGCPYDYCAGGRVGRLCGRCPAGMGLVFFSERCAADSDCNDARWATVVALGAALCVVVFLVVTTPRPSSGTFSVLLFFYQAMPLVKRTPWQAPPPIVTTVLTSFFGMSLTGESGGPGVCIVPSMTAVQRLGARMLFQGVVLCVFVLQYVCHGALHRLSVPWFREHRPDGIHYLGAFVQFLTIAYMTLVLVPLQMLQCVEVTGQLVWWYDAEISCYDDPSQKAAIVAIALLSPLPLVCAVVVYRWRNAESGSSAWRLEVRRVLTAGLSAKRRWWLGVSLLRRLLLVIASTSVHDQTWSGVVATVLCILFVVMNLRLQPFETLSTHKFETISLTLLACLAASSSPALARIQYGTVEDISNANVLEWLQFCVAVGPAVGFVALVVGQEVQARWLRRAKSVEQLVAAASGDAEGLSRRESSAFVCSSCSRPIVGDSSLAEEEDEEWELRAMESFSGLPATCAQCQFC